MNMDDVNWCPRPSGKPIQVMSPGAGQTLRVIAAGAVCGVLTHWDGHKSVPCTCQVKAAPRLCEVQAPTWRGYLPAVFSNNRRVIVEVTYGAVTHCPELLQEALLGWWIKITRPGKKVNSAVYAEILKDLRRAPHVEAYDPRPRLMEMWGFLSADRNGSYPSDAPTDALSGGLEP